MSVGRQDHTATVLRDGKVLVAGGYDASQAALASAEIYDPATGIFTPTAPMASGRGHHTATLLGDGLVLVAGGHDGYPGGSLASAELYDPAGRTFTSIGELTDARGSHSATTLADGTVLVAGGYTAFPFIGTDLASAEIYDPPSGRFTPTTSMHQARGRHAAALLLNGNVLVAGGLDGCCGSLSSAEIYSLSLVDTLPPRITTTGDLTVVTSSLEGAVVNYNVTVVDNIDDNPQLACAPPSGSVFPLGVTTVTCTATDSVGNVSTASFNVSVLPPLDISLSLRSSGTVSPTTGVASVSGSMACNRQTHIILSGELKQTIATRGLVVGSSPSNSNARPPGRHGRPRLRRRAAGTSPEAPSSAPSPVPATNSFRATSIR
jgi:hypothetical protein